MKYILYLLAVITHSLFALASFYSNITNAYFIRINLNVSVSEHEYVPVFPWWMVSASVINVILSYTSFARLFTHTLNKDADILVDVIIVNNH